jgi:hypothetical protein
MLFHIKEEEDEVPENAKKKQHKKHKHRKKIPF